MAKKKSYKYPVCIELEIKRAEFIANAEDDGRSIVSVQCWYPSDAEIKRFCGTNPRQYIRMQLRMVRPSRRIRKGERSHRTGPCPAQGGREKAF